METFLHILWKCIDGHKVTFSSHWLRSGVVGVNGTRRRCGNGKNCLIPVQETLGFSVTGTVTSTEPKVAVKIKGAMIRRGWVTTGAGTALHPTETGRDGAIKTIASTEVQIDQAVE
jgi:hypothetical protein